MNYFETVKGISTRKYFKDAETKRTLKIKVANIVLQSVHHILTKKLHEVII